MSHPVPKELKGEERLFSVPYLELHFNKKATLYCGIATVIAGMMLRVNFKLFMVMFIVLNLIAYPLGAFRVQTTKFEGGNVAFDTFFIRKLKYKKHRNIYLRRRGK